MNPIAFEAASLRFQEDSESKSMRKSQEFSGRKNDSGSSTGKKNPYLPQGLHTAGRKVNSALKKDRYKRDDRLGQTMTDLGSLKLVNKKLDFEQHVLRENQIHDVNSFDKNRPKLNSGNENSQEESDRKSEEFEF